MGALDNAAIAEWLARHAEQADGPYRARALRRAARAALSWPVEASALLEAGRPLEELYGVGPRIAERVRRLLETGEPPGEPPPERRGFITMARARAALDEQPAWRAVRGDLQTHSEWSDGSGTLEAMAEAAAARGYEWLAVTDHSKGLAIAGGLDEARLREQGREIERINGSSPVRLLRSVEMNLDPRGRGDLDSELLGELDVVLGAFHSALRRGEDQTERYLAALDNPSIDILAHPRGRVWNFRRGLSADWERVIAHAAARGVALEVDAYPDRQDLDVELLALAAGAGTTISVGTDAHHPEQLGYIDLGLGALALAGVPPARVLNRSSAAELADWRRQRPRA
jgi:histidinol phosphatase-like PHP family hydrolase